MHWCNDFFKQYGPFNRPWETKTSSFSLSFIYIGANNFFLQAKLDDLDHSCALLVVSLLFLSSSSLLFLFTIQLETDAFFLIGRNKYEYTRLAVRRRQLSAHTHTSFATCVNMSITGHYFTHTRIQSKWYYSFFKHTFSSSIKFSMAMLCLANATACSVLRQQVFGGKKLKEK